MLYTSEMTNPASVMILFFGGLFERCIGCLVGLEAAPSAQLQKERRARAAVALQNYPAATGHCEHSFCVRILVNLLSFIFSSMYMHMQEIMYRGCVNY
jgi:hypothetical protein